MRLIYSREAVDDLIRLRAFIAEHSPDAAVRVAESLVARIEQLGRFPHMGVAVEQAAPPADIRDMMFGNYMVRYSVHGEALAILRIWHHYKNRTRQSRVSPWLTSLATSRRIPRSFLREKRVDDKSVRPR